MTREILEAVAVLLGYGVVLAVFASWLRSKLFDNRKAGDDD